MLTFSGRKTLCSAKKLEKEDVILKDVNECLRLCAFEGAAEPPEIPESLSFKPPIQSVKELASEIGRELQKAVDTSDCTPEEAIASFMQHGFDFSNNLVAYRDDPDMSKSMWAVVNTRLPNVRIPGTDAPANELLFSIFVLSAKTRPSLTKTCLHQWILIPGSFTMAALADVITCPLCKLSDDFAGPHRAPRTFEFSAHTLFDFKAGFDVRVADAITAVNDPFRFQSRGGCSHVLICGSVVAVHLDSPDNLPMEIGGRGANPPYCWKCNVRPASFCVRQPDSEFEFFCKLCFDSETFEEGSFITDLTSSFFIPR